MIEIIPAIDVIDGNCVRLSQGEYESKKKYYDNPLDIAKIYEDLGVRRLHIVDLDGAKSSSPSNLHVLENIASNTSLDIQYGGGIKNEDSLKRVLDAGARRAICGSIAVTSPDMFVEWLHKYGYEHIILGADAKKGMIAINGWLDSSTVSVEDVISKFAPEELSQVICTDISKDGMLQGPSYDLYVKLQGSFPGIEITASGGISCMDDIVKLDDLNIRSVIVGKAIYEEAISFKQLRDYFERFSTTKK